MNDHDSCQVSSPNIGSKPNVKDASKSSFAICNIKHETKQNIKRHASLLMSCCRTTEQNKLEPKNALNLTANLSHKNNEKSTKHKARQRSQTNYCEFSPSQEQYFGDGQFFSKMFIEPQLSQSDRKQNFSSMLFSNNESNKLTPSKYSSTPLSALKTSLYNNTKGNGTCIDAQTRCHLSTLAMKSQLAKSKQLQCTSVPSFQQQMKTFNVLTIQNNQSNRLSNEMSPYESSADRNHSLKQPKSSLYNNSLTSNEHSLDLVAGKLGQSPISHAHNKLTNHSSLGSHQTGSMVPRPHHGHHPPPQSHWKYPHFQQH